MDEKRDVEELEKVFTAGDAWLRKYGMVTSIAHNAIVTNLYLNFPKVRYLEYFLPEDTGRRKVWVNLYVPFWKLLFSNRDRMIDDVIVFLREYLSDYDIRVELKRYRKGVEKSNEIPKNASDHVGLPPIELQPAPEPTPASEPKPDAPKPEGGDNPSSDPAPEPGPGDVGKVPSGESG